MPTRNPFAVLVRHRNFRIFWIGQTLSLIGTWMQVMASAWLALELTNNPFLVGLVATAESLPIVLLSLYAGVLVDRYERLRLVKVAQSMLLIEAAVLTWLTVTGRISIGWLLLLATAAGTFSSIEIPSRQSLIIELAGREDLPQAIALNSSGFNLARIVGPAVAALVIARLNIGWAFGLNALSYLAVLVGLFMIRLNPWRPSATLVRPVDAIRESFRYMRGTPQVASLMKIVTVYSILGVPYLTLMPVFARDRLGLGAGGYGMLLACVGIGGLAGAIALAARPARAAGSRTFVVSSIAFPIILLSLAFVRRPHLAYPLLLLAGIAMISNGALSNSMLQHRVPDALRGRIMAAYSFVVVGLAQTIGSFTAGAVGKAFGVHWAIAGGAIIMLGYAAYAFRQPEMGYRTQPIQSGGTSGPAPA